MATTNNKCKKCGCEDKFITSPAPCPTPEGCPTPQPCSEVFDAQCVVYTGADIECGEDVVVEKNTTMADALHDIVDYFCQNIPPAPVYSYQCNGTTCLQVVGTGGQFATLAACQAACQAPVFSYNCVDCNCVQVQGTSGEFDTLAECEEACQFRSPCGVSTSCDDLKLCIPCEGCLNPLQYFFNLSLTLFCNQNCYCSGVNSIPAATEGVDPGYDPYGVYDGNYYYTITFVTGPTIYYLWYSNADGKWYLTSALGNKTSIFASLTRDSSCPWGTYTSLASPITQFIVEFCDDGGAVPA
jgi:hypothetical protein